MTHASDLLFTATVTQRCNCMCPVYVSCRELREGARRACEQRQSTKLTDAAKEAANAARMAAVRKRDLAMQRHEHDAKQQQYRESKYKPTQGSPVSTMQARLQALAMGTDCSPRNSSTQ